MIVGIDPGQKGGIAIMNGYGEVLDAVIMPKTVAGIANFINRATDGGGTITMVVERAQPMPKQGVTSVFTYGQHYGGFEAIAASFGFKYVTVRPTVWKKAMGLNSDKTSSIIEAERLFPDVSLIPPGCRKPSDGVAEAILISEWARRNNI